MYIINAASQTFQIANESNEHFSSISQPGVFEVCSNSGQFSILLTKQEANKKIVVYFKWLSKKQKTMQISNEILSAIICHYGDAIYGNEILGFTEMEKEKILYRADIDYRGLGCWYDNVMVDWEATDYLIPAELRMFFQMKNSNQSFALIHSCHDRCIYHLVLSRIWIKEYQGDTLNFVWSLKPYSLHDCCEEKSPLFRVIPCEATHSHCLLMPLDINSHQCIQILSSSNWGDEFYTIP